jgi:PAS domain S-box-containing protein
MLPADQEHLDLDEALQRARATVHTLLELTPEPTIVHRDGQIAYANPAFARALGIPTAEDLTGSALEALLHPDDRGAIGSRLRAPAANATQETVALRWRCASGHWRTTEAVAAPIEFEGAPAVVIVARDTTERAEFQHHLVERDRMSALGTLSAGVAHEINNPLTYLLVNLEHVLRRLRAASASDDPIAELTAPDPQLDAGAPAPNRPGVPGRQDRHGSLLGLVQSLQQAVEGANRVRQIVRDLLTFSQGHVENRGAVDVRGLVESAVQIAWHEIRHRARLVKAMADAPPVDANEARLGQVFLNLLINAAQAIPEGHADKNEIRVATRTDDRGYAVIEVSDSGVGIAREDMPHIFDPFFTTKDGGSGLGLAISHGTIKGLGGEIQASSVPGRGSTFRVLLPPAKSWRSATPSSAQDVRALPRRRVLVIDDERMVCEAIARSLYEDGDVEVETEAKQALARIAAGERYDLVLCDLMMPVMTGMDLYAEVVRIAPMLAGRFVFMTGGAFTPRARAFLASVVNPCLEKPLDMGKLRSLVARARRD